MVSFTMPEGGMMVNICPSYAEEAKAAADSNRLIPPYNADANSPADVYSLHDIVPETEWKALSVSALYSAKSDLERTRLLPYTRSMWVNQRLTPELYMDSSGRRNLWVTRWNAGSLLTFYL
jgi:DNA-directed RNA polymerase I subunit RPA49